MRQIVLSGFVASIALFAPSLARSGPREEALATYMRFADAQNAHDLSGVRAELLDSPQFLWVSDGKSFWGRETMLARMAKFQSAEVWIVTPGLAEAVTVEINSEAAYVHLPLTLTLGFKAKPDVLEFLVSALCVKTAAGWRISALFTTFRNYSKE